MKLHRPGLQSWEPQRKKAEAVARRRHRLELVELFVVFAYRKSYAKDTTEKLHGVFSVKIVRFNSVVSQYQISPGKTYRVVCKHYTLASQCEFSSGCLEVLSLGSWSLMASSE